MHTNMMSVLSKGYDDDGDDDVEDSDIFDAEI